MPRYHFNVHDQLGSTEDPEGLEFPGPGPARDEALRGARSLIAADVMEGRLDLSGRITVTDESGTLLFVVRFAEAVGGATSHAVGRAVPDPD